MSSAPATGREGYAIMYEGADLFTRPCILRNMENVMLDMIERPEMAHYLFDQFTTFYCEDITRALEATDGGFDIYCEWSDYGTQRALLMSVPMFREFIAPYLKRLIDVVHQAGVKFMAHSCGAIRPLIPDLIALGADVLDPIQVAAEGMEPAALKRDFGSQLAFHGAICTQRTLPFGTPQEVTEAVLHRVATLGAGGGYILAASHDISADTPSANIVAMYEPELQNDQIMPNKKMPILCVGQLVADIVVRPVGGLPVPGRTELVEDLQLLAGGCAANTAAVLAKLGAKMRLAALIGQDALGDAVLAELETTGVGLEAVVREADAPTAAAIVLVSDNGERSFFYRNGGNELLANSHVADSVLKAASIRARGRRAQALEPRSGRTHEPGEILRLRYFPGYGLGRAWQLDAKARMARCPGSTT